ncbi:hypothetical protein K4H04_26185, partial [Mycobacterium tuberculosis]|nr:hypothetical protein [Mycobacterium tuberculosis]
GDYLTNRPFFKAASEDSLTPYQLELQVDKATETDAETLKLRQRIKELAAGSATAGLENASQGYASAAKRAAQMEQA